MTETPDPIDVSLHRAITVTVGGMLGHGPEPEIASVVLETIEAAGFRVVPIVDDATRQEVRSLIERLRAKGRWVQTRFVPLFPQMCDEEWQVDPDAARSADLLAAAYLGRTDG